MLLRSKKQASPPLKLVIIESGEKKALKKRHRHIYGVLKRRYKIRRRNVIVPFLK